MVRNEKKTFQTSKIIKNKFEHDQQWIMQENIVKKVSYMLIGKWFSHIQKSNSVDK